MVKSLILLNLIFFALIVKSQDTVYSYPYPSGIVTKRIDKSITGYKIYPIDNPKLEIILRKQEVKSINYFNSEVWLNQSFKIQNYTVLPSDNLTGRIFFSDIVINKQLLTKELFIIAKKLTASSVQFSLISEDLTNFSFQKYSANMKTKFAGDLYSLEFDFLIEFKDGKAKITCNNFMVERRILKSLSNIAKTVSFDKSKQSTLESMYCQDIRTGDQKGFWVPIKEGVLELSNNLVQIINSSSKQGDDW